MGTCTVLSMLLPRAPGARCGLRTRCCSHGFGAAPRETMLQCQGWHGNGTGILTWCFTAAHHHWGLLRARFQAKLFPGAVGCVSGTRVNPAFPLCRCLVWDNLVSGGSDAPGTEQPYKLELSAGKWAELPQLGAAGCSPRPAPARGCSGCCGEEKLSRDRMGLSPRGLASFVKLCLQGNKCHQLWIGLPEGAGCWEELAKPRSRSSGPPLCPPRLSSPSSATAVRDFVTVAVPTVPPPAPHGAWACPATPSHWIVPWMGWGEPTPFPGLALGRAPGHCLCLCCCATGWFLVATSPCCGRRWVPYAGAFIPSADRQPAVWPSNPNCSQCARTKNCLERWQGLGGDDMLGIFLLPWTPPSFSPTSCKKGGSSSVLQAGWDAFPLLRAEWVQNPVPRQAEGCPWECVLSCSTGLCRVPASPVCSGEETANATGAPGSPTQPLWVPEPEDSCGTAGWWWCCCPGAPLCAQGCCSQADKTIWGGAAHRGAFAGCCITPNLGELGRRMVQGEEGQDCLQHWAELLLPLALTCHFCSLASLTCHGSLPAVGQP